MLIYSDVIKESAAFYSGICPGDTSKAKISMEAIGRTITERFPVLATSDAKNPWSYFNTKLSSAMRNSRCRIKRKLTPPHHRPTKAVRVENPSRDLDETEYVEFVQQLKKVVSNKKADMTNIKTLLQTTFNNRRKWINNSLSTDLPLSRILTEYPCFRMPSCILEELRLITSNSAVSEFPGTKLALIFKYYFF